MKISVIGTGYLGITHAVCMSELGHSVIGVDSDNIRIERQKNGNPTIFEPYLDEMLSRNLKKRRIKFSTNFADIEEADVHFICVGTPEYKGGGYDMSQVMAAVNSVLDFCKPNSLIVGKSTVPPGTMKSLEELALRRGLVHLDFAWNPEFLREGIAVMDTLKPSRIVIGTRNAHTAAKLKQLYEPILTAGVDLIETDPETSELIKVAANSFLAMKISFINGYTQLCKEVGANPIVLSKSLGLDHRIAPSFLNPGLGFGGACLPKDLKAAAWGAGAHNVKSLQRLFEATQNINEEMHNVAVDTIMSVISQAKNRTLGVLGLTFKPGTDDIRESPAMRVVNELLMRGINVVAHDPLANEPTFKDSGYKRVERVEQIFDETNVVALLTEWPEYKEIIPPKALNESIVLDFRYALDQKIWNGLNWEFLTLSTQMKN